MESCTLYVHPYPVRLDWVESPVVADGYRPEYPDTRLPVVTFNCAYCGRSVDRSDVGILTRVNGDSRYGYEPTHTGCVGRDPFPAGAVVGYPADYRPVPRPVNRDVPVADRFYVLDVMSDGTAVYGDYWTGDTFPVEPVRPVEYLSTM